MCVCHTVLMSTSRKEGRISCLTHFYLYLATKKLCFIFGFLKWLHIYLSCILYCLDFLLEVHFVWIDRPEWWPAKALNLHFSVRVAKSVWISKSPSIAKKSSTNNASMIQFQIRDKIAQFLIWASQKNSYFVAKVCSLSMFNKQACSRFNDKKGSPTNIGPTWRSTSWIQLRKMWWMDLRELSSSR